MDAWNEERRGVEREERREGTDTVVQSSWRKRKVHVHTRRTQKDKFKVNLQPWVSWWQSFSPFGSHWNLVTKRKSWCKLCNATNIRGHMDWHELQVRLEPPWIWVRIFRLQKPFNLPLTLQIVTFLLRQWFKISREVRMHYLNFFHARFSFFSFLLILYIQYSGFHSTNTSESPHSFRFHKDAQSHKPMPVWKYSWPLWFVLLAYR